MRAGWTNTAKHAPNMRTHHGHVTVSVCKVSIKWNIQTNPYLSSEPQIAGAESVLLFWVQAVENTV